MYFNHSGNTVQPSLAISQVYNEIPHLCLCRQTLECYNLIGAAKFLQWNKSGYSSCHHPTSRFPRRLDSAQLVCRLKIAIKSLRDLTALLVVARPRACSFPTVTSYLLHYSNFRGFYFRAYVCPRKTRYVAPHENFPLYGISYIHVQCTCT